jgi:hypothetical protein
MKLTILSALAAALVTAGAAHAQPFNFLNGPGAREDTVATSPAPFNFLNHPGDSDLVTIYPDPIPGRHRVMHKGATY